MKATLESYLKRKLDYTTTNKHSAKYVADSKAIRTEFFEKVKNLIPNSAFVKMEESKKNLPVNQKSTINSLTIQALVVRFNSDLVDEFISSTQLSDEDIKIIFNNTKAQSESMLWFEQRSGKITASKVKRVYTAMNTALKYNTEPFNHISEVLWKETVVQTWQMKHDISSEKHAKIKYKNIVKSHHENILFIGPGINVSRTHVFLSVTPDIEINCSCHGPGVVEIKCPPSIGVSPSDINYKHLKKMNDKVMLKRKSEYFFQVQCQMAVKEVVYADFFFFTLHGYHLERI
ncbi:uncharacterized protein LOC105845087 [Hydra vulgaris]|uniref:uncharacterized protein LOC105845087 n=1 Tax=Hydra vulgaris TaxID=6087 RepID=UPI001F5EB493|nr:uncharacterized protein LOC105845087 [Hydra vulgaris]